MAHTCTARAKALEKLRSTIESETGPLPDDLFLALSCAQCCVHALRRLRLALDRMPEDDPEQFLHLQDIAEDLEFLKVYVLPDACFIKSLAADFNRLRTQHPFSFAGVSTANAHSAAFEMASAAVSAVEHRFLDRKPIKNLGLSDSDHNNLIRELTQEAVALAKSRRPQLTVASRESNEAEEPEEPEEPVKNLLGWPEIMVAIGRKNGPRERRRIAGLNERFDGPIKIGVRGGQPMAKEAELVEWWGTLADRHEELANRRRDKQTTVQEQHNYGRNGTVVPEIAGSVKRSRKKPRK